MTVQPVASVDAAALFGSAARQDNDILSDHDLLLVAERSSTLDVSAKLMDQAGWSCTSYSWSRLERSISTGSLFGIHLRNEAIVLRDPKGRLRDLVRCARPRPAGYGDEFYSACILITELSAMPDTAMGRAWALDVLMVGFRAAAVAFLANEEQYIFSFAEILNRLRFMGLISTTDSHMLRRLRAYKVSYRTRVGVTPTTFEEVRRSIDVVSRLFRLSMHVRPVTDQDIFERVLGQSRGNSMWYRDSRLAELAVASARQSASDPLAFGAEKLALLKLLRKPTDYGGFMHSRWPIVKGRVLRLCSNGSR